MNIDIFFFFFFFFFCGERGSCTKKNETQFIFVFQENSLFVTAQDRKMTRPDVL